MLLCLPFTDVALKGHFGKVRLSGPPLIVAVKLLCLQHVREVECEEIKGCEVSISVRCNDDSCLASLDSVRIYPPFHMANFKPVSKPVSNRFNTGAFTWPLWALRSITSCRSC